MNAASLLVAANGLGTFRDKDAVQQLPRLKREVLDRLQLMQEELQQCSAAGGRRCEGAGKSEWQQQVAELSIALEGLLQETRKFDEVYQQVRCQVQTITVTILLC